MFFWNSLPFCMIQRILAIWSLVPLPSLNPAWTFWKFTVHILLKPGLENFEHYFTSMRDEYNWVVVWAFFGITFLWDWNKNWPFPVLWKILSCGKFLKRWEYQTILHASWEIYMQVKKQQLEPGMEQWTGSKLGKKYVKAVYCHSAYLNYMQCTSCEMPGWMNHKLESKFPGEISTTSDM